MRCHRWLLFLVFASLGATGCATEECPTGNGISPVCGFLAPEDLEVVPGEQAIIVGGFSLDNEDGDIRVLRLADESVQKLYPPDTALAPANDGEIWGDPNCPGPPEGFAAHGIHLTENASGNYTLLVVNHTSREAIEWFEIIEEGGNFQAGWRGCVIIDEELWVNDVAMFPDGGFVASHMMPREIAATLFDREPNDRVETGYLVEWQLGAGWKKIEGTDGALPNGVQVSADGRVIYNNHYLADQTVAFDRASGQRLWTSQIKGAPDNLSITPDGKLLTSSHLESLRAIRESMLKKDAYSALHFAVHYIEPKDGTVTPVFESSGPPFGGSTVAVQAGDTIYLGAFAGNRIGRIAAPQ